MGLKVLANGEVVAAQVPISSFTRIGIYLDEDNRVTQAGRFLLDRERVA